MRHSLAVLPWEVWLIGLISLVNDGASELIYPLLPLYLSSVLMAGPRALGLIEGWRRPRPACSSSSPAWWSTAPGE